MNSLQVLNNSELTSEIYALTKRYGELSLWLAEAELKIFTMICTDSKIVTLGLEKEIDIKQAADLERWKVLSQIKRCEIEMERRVNGKENSNTNGA